MWFYIDIYCILCYRTFSGKSIANMIFEQSKVDDNVVFWLIQQNQCRNHVCETSSYHTINCTSISLTNYKYSDLTVFLKMLILFFHIWACAAFSPLWAQKWSMYIHPPFSATKNDGCYYSWVVTDVLYNSIWYNT